MQKINFIKNFLDGTLEKPDLEICDISQSITSMIPNNLSKELNMNLVLNGISTMNFEVSRHYNDDDGKTQELKAYDQLVQGRETRIHTKGYGWWVVNTIDDDKILQNKKISCKSLETELEYVPIYGYGSSMNEDSSEMSMFKLYDEENQEYSALHLVLKATPYWNIGYISPNISKNAHQLLWDEMDCYKFLTDLVANSFDCIFIFDTENRKINVYKSTDEEISKKTKIYLTKETLKELVFKDDRNTLYTALKLIGGEDESTGTPFSIQDVNNGSDILINMEFVKQYFSSGLRKEYDDYITYKKGYDIQYASLMQQLHDAQLARYNLVDKVPVHDQVWTEYGLNQLKVAMAANAEIRDLYIRMNGKPFDDQYTTANNNYNAILLEIGVRQNQIQEKDDLITAYQNMLSEINSALAIDKYLSPKNYIEYKKWYKQTTLQNSDFVAYDTMTAEEKYKLANEFKEQGIKKLSEISVRQFEVEVSSVNLLNMKEFQHYVDELDLGSMITIDASEKIDGSVRERLRLLEINVSFDKDKKFEMKFANKTSLTNQFAELKDSAKNSENILSYNISNVNKAVKRAKDASTEMQGDKNVKMQRITTGDLQEFVVDSGGLWGRGRNADGSFDPRMIHVGSSGIILSNDYFNPDSVKVGIGQVEYNGNTYWGINAGLIYADLYLGSQMRLTNNGNTMMFDGNGLSITNGINTFKVNPNDASLFQMLKNSSKVVYMDSSGNAHFEGTVSSSHIIGGDANFGNGTTIISSTGHITTNSLEATNAKISGTITSSTISGSEFVTVNTADVSALSIKEGNVFLNYSGDSEYTCNNGYIRGRINGTSEFVKLIGISQNSNIVIGHDKDIANPYCTLGRTVDINCYSSAFNFKKGSNGNERVDIKNGSYQVLDSYNCDNYVCSKSDVSRLESLIETLFSSVGSLETRVSALE